MAKTAFGLLVVLALGCIPPQQRQGGAYGQAGGTCDDACIHYMQCKGSQDQQLYQMCVAKCSGAQPTSETLAQYQQTDCATAVSMFEQGAQPGQPGTGGQPGMGGQPGVTPQPAETGIFGSWYYSDNKNRYVLTLSQDGSGTLNNGPFKFKLDKDQLTVTAMSGQSMTYKAEQSGDFLTMSGGDLPGPATLRRGPMGQLAGVYRAYESSVNPSIIISYSQYVTLFPDGTVAWSKSEGGSSISQTSENWARFRTWHQGGEPIGQAGTWQSDGQTIQVNWRLWGGKTSQGQVNLAGGKFALTGMGVLSEGATLKFERQ